MESLSENHPSFIILACFSSLPLISSYSKKSIKLYNNIVNDLQEQSHHSSPFLSWLVGSLVEK